MDCDRFHKLFVRFMAFPLPGDATDSTEYSDWAEHRRECLSCAEWYLIKEVESRGVDLAEYPCVHVAYYSTQPCDMHSDAWECTDMTLVRTVSGFGIPVRDGGTSLVAIQYCPWCGVKL